MKYIKRFINDLLYGYPAFSNLRFGIKENIKERLGYYRMKELSGFDLMMKYGEILTHKRRFVEPKNIKKLLKAVQDYNSVIKNI